MIQKIVKKHRLQERTTTQDDLALLAEQDARGTALPPSIICAPNIMKTQPDFRELLALFNVRHVEYLIVGGYALAFHGAPRFTKDAPQTPGAPAAGLRSEQSRA